MADPDDILKRYGPADPRWLTPEDLADRKLHPASVNQFALPPREPRAELRNPAPRPDAYVDKNTREYVMGPGPFALTMLAPAFTTGQTAGQAYNDLAAGDYKAAAPSLAELLVGMAPIPGMKKGAMPPRVENPIRAYHGSPHDFDKFDLSKIGTGEGAQAYGHGTYLAESEAVAKSYRDALAHKGASNEFLNGIKERLGLDDDASGMLYRLATEGRQTLDAAKAMQMQVPSLRDPGPFSVVGPKREAIAAEIDRIRDATRGRMYEVAIHATPDQFLDWDKPLSQQSEAVRQALANAGVSSEPTYTTRTAFGREVMEAKMPGGSEAVVQPINGKWTVNLGSADPYAEFPTKQQALDYVARRFNEEIQIGGEIVKGPNAASALFEAGIPGIRYLDQGSRGSGQGTSNYVVFDPNLIEILRKYGIAGPVAGLTTADILAKYGRKDDQ